MLDIEMPTMDGIEMAEKQIFRIMDVYDGRLRMIELHMYSRYRDDGEYSPIELAEQCVKAGVRKMSITDHNKEMRII